MKKIGIISDTHAYWDDKYLTHFESCDEIWHAGTSGRCRWRNAWQSSGL